MSSICIVLGLLSCSLDDCAVCAMTFVEECIDVNITGGLTVLATAWQAEWSKPVYSRAIAWQCVQRGL
jgi:hypothetical protein